MQGMNENRVQQVLDIEEKAQAIHKNAISESEELLIQAERDALPIIEKARAEAEEEASQLISNAWGEEETARILDEAEESAKGIETLAANNLDRAMSYVFSRITKGE
jgi:vacuolar-type H+-ATPase subunit H